MREQLFKIKLHTDVICAMCYYHELFNKTNFAHDDEQDRNNTLSTATFQTWLYTLSVCPITYVINEVAPYFYIIVSSDTEIQHLENRSIGDVQ